MPLVDVVGNVKRAAPEQIGNTGSKVGMIAGSWVIVTGTVKEQLLASVTVKVCEPAASHV